MFEKFKSGDSSQFSKNLAIMSIMATLENIDSSSEFYFKKEGNIIKIKAPSKNNNGMIYITIVDETLPNTNSKKTTKTPTERRKNIAELIVGKPLITQTELAKIFMVSQKTISNDLAVLKKI